MRTLKLASLGLLLFTLWPFSGLINVPQAHAQKPDQNLSTSTGRSFEPDVSTTALAEVSGVLNLFLGIGGNRKTPTPIATRPIATSTSIPTFTPTSAPTFTLIPTFTSTSTPTSTPTSSPTPFPTSTLAATATPTSTPSGHLYGLVGQGGLGEQIDTTLLQQQYNAGVRLHLLQLGWDVLQPSGSTSWDVGIASAFQQRIDAFVLNNPDTKVVLDLGVQYPPSWAAAVDPLVDQYGHTWQAHFPDGGVNVYWSPTVRQYVAGYIQRVFSSLNFRGRLWAVRVGAYKGELMYPEQANSGQNLSFWAFDSQAQVTNPVPNWRPGQISPNGEAQSFYFWYVDNLANTFNFFQTEIRRYYQGYIAPVTPGVGVWEGNVNQLVGRNLYDLSLDHYGTGNYWQRIFTLLPGANQGIINWCSSMGDGSGNEDSLNWWEWSSARVQAYLAHQAGREIFGENNGQNAYDTSSGADPRTTMQAIFNVMQSRSYLGLLWLSQSDMANPSYASLDQYRNLISQTP